MARYRTTIESSLPAEVAFAELADFSSAATWDPGVVSAQRIDQGELGIGSRFHLECRVARRTVPLLYEIIDFVEDRRLVLRAENNSIISVDTITFEAKATGGTWVTYDADLQLKGALRVLDPVLSIMFQRIGNQAREGLRRALRHVPEGSR